MLTRGEHQRVVDALALHKVSVYIQYGDQSLDMSCPWNESDWQQILMFARSHRWRQLNWYLFLHCEPFLREVLEKLIQSVSPRLYQEVFCHDHTK